MAGAAMGMAIGQGVTDMAQSGLGAYFTNRETNQAWSRQKAVYTRRYQWMMNDMKKAGLNPILAYQQGPAGGAAVPQSSSPHVQGSNYVASAKEAALMGAQLRNIDAQTAKTQAETDAVAATNQQREFYGKLWEKANRVLDVLIDKYGPVIEKYAPEAVRALEEPSRQVNSGRSAGEFKGEYVRPGLRWDASSQKWVPSGEPGYKFENRTKGGYYEDWSR